MKNTTRIVIVLGISITFFIAEISVGLHTKSLALIADAFHYLNDIVTFILAFVAAYLQETRQPTDKFTYAFHRAELVSAFFNSVFLLALALSIFLQSIERFIHVAPVESPVLMMAIGCTGLGLNILSAMFVHDHHGHDHTHGHGHGHTHGHGHSIHPIELKKVAPIPDHIHAAHNHTINPPSSVPQRNLGLLAVMVHVVGDAINNIGVIVASVIMWKLDSPNRFYADPIASLIISFILFGGTIPTTLKSGRILLEATPPHLDLAKVKEDLLPDVLSVHDVHVWNLSQSIVLASLHVRIPAGTSLQQWEKTERYMQQCFTEYGITHVTISPEIQKDTDSLESTEDLAGGCKYPSQDDFSCSVTDLKKQEFGVAV